MNKIEKKITGFNVKKEGEPLADKAEVVAAPALDVMSETVNRPEALVGSTYKIKAPTMDHAMYVTINDMVMNQGTEHESRVPFEMFINSKDMGNYQWVVALTLLVSAVFRKGGDVTFIADELGGVFDPQGGYFKRGGKFMPSLVAEIGLVIKEHMTTIGLITPPELSDHEKSILAEKRAAFEASSKQSTEETVASEFPANATLCPKCHTKAVILMDGCSNCLNCFDSKCA